MYKTRSGRVYKSLQSAVSMAEETGGSTGGSTQVYEGTASDQMAQMLEMLMEDRRRRELEIAEERRQREEEQRREQERRAAEDERRERETQRQMDLLQGLIEGIHKQGESAEKRAEKDKDMKLTKLTERDDIKAYLTTFERMMVSYEIKPDRWVFKLAPQLTRKA